jgi:glycosyltransferase involved in cell wall biosynthesis
MAKVKNTDEIKINSSPSVAILLPVASIKFLSSTLKSISNQDYPIEKLQLFIVSTGILEKDVLKILPSNLIEVTKIINCNSKGISYSLNLGLKLIHTEFVARIDDDDIMQKQRIRTQVDFLRNNPDIDVVGSRIELIDSDNKMISFKSYPLHDLQLRKTILDQSPLAHPAVMFRSDKVLRLGGYRNMPSEDVDLWVRIMEQGKIANLDQVLTSYRLHPGQGSNFEINSTDIPRRILWTSFLLRSQGLLDFPKSNIETFDGQAWKMWINENRDKIKSTLISRLLLSTIWDINPKFFFGIHMSKKLKLRNRFLPLAKLVLQNFSSSVKWLQLKVLKFFYRKFLYRMNKMLNIF